MTLLAFAPAVPVLGSHESIAGARNRGAQYALPVRWLRPRSASVPTAERPRASPVMIQRPDMDGPPDLSAYFDKSAQAVGRTGAPISVGTGRAVLVNFDGDSSAATAAALATALEAVKDDGLVQLCHCTLSLDVDALAVHAALRDGLGDATIPIVGRTVNKKDSSGTVEVMVLLSDEAAGITFGEAASGAGSTEELPSAASTAAAEAASKALTGLASPESCTFMMFSHTPGAPPSSVRDGIEKALPGVIAYGGPAVGSEESGEGWVMFGAGADGREVVSGSFDTQHVAVAAIPGSINFLISSVVKNWAQPTFTEPLSYMTPTYVDDPVIDLLTAIRYDDWEKFTYCLDDQGVDVNVKWVEKQNQSPLLAACARCRTKMIEYMIAKGADVQHRNAGNFTAAMYTRKLTEYDPAVVLAQLKTLQDAGLDVVLSEEDEAATRASGGDGRIFMDNP